MSDTPRTDTHIKSIKGTSIGYAGGVDEDFCKQLERELAEYRDKAIRFDLDKAGIEHREKEAIELVEARAEIERLRASERSAWNAAMERDEEIERLRKDAERYRWLRGDSCADSSSRWTQWEVRCWRAPAWTADLRRVDLDAAVDESMKATSGT
jgi:hypothetical protein